jgi:hypothetical protein
MNQTSEGPAVPSADAVKIKARYGISCFPNVGCNYWNIPKCGGTSIRAALIEAEAASPALGITDTNRDDLGLAVEIHSVNRSQFVSAKTAMSNGLLNFSVIRHPVARASSMYRDIILRRPDFSVSGSSLFKKEIRIVRKNPSMRTFMKVIGGFEDKDVDIHFRSSSSILTIGDTIVVKTIYRLEELGERIENLNVLLNRPLRMLHLNRAFAEVKLDDTSIEMITRRYRRDLDLWNSLVS